MPAICPIERQPEPLQRRLHAPQALKEPCEARGNHWAGTPPAPPTPLNRAQTGCCSRDENGSASAEGLCRQRWLNSEGRTMRGLRVAANRPEQTGLSLRGSRSSSTHLNRNASLRSISANPCSTMYPARVPCCSAHSDSSALIYRDNNGAKKP